MIAAGCPTVGGRAKGGLEHSLPVNTWYLNLCPGDQGSLPKSEEGMHPTRRRSEVFAPYSSNPMSG